MFFHFIIFLIIKILKTFISTKSIAEKQNLQLAGSSLLKDLIIRVLAMSEDHVE